MAALNELKDAENKKKEDAWVRKVEVADNEYVVGGIENFPMYFVAFPCPFNGFMDAQAMVKPIEDEQALLDQLKKSRFAGFFCWLVYVDNLPKYHVNGLNPQWRTE